MPEEEREEYRREAKEFLRVMRGMADCSWTPSDWAWLARRNRSALQQSEEGRKQLRGFDGRQDAATGDVVGMAPLLMDGRKDRVTGEVGAIRTNRLKLNELSSRTGKPIVPLCAFHDKPKTKEGVKLQPEKMDADDFRGLESELLMCEGARVLLTQNLWVEAGLRNGALGTLRGYMWPEGGDPHSKEKEK